MTHFNGIIIKVGVSFDFLGGRSNNVLLGDDAFVEFSDFDF
jgi:hypothetical protein